MRDYGARRLQGEVPGRWPPAARPTPRAEPRGAPKEEERAVTTGPPWEPVVAQARVRVSTEDSRVRRLPLDGPARFRELTPAEWQPEPFRYVAVERYLQERL